MKEIPRSKLIEHSRLSNERILQVVRYFADEKTATETARLTGLNRNSVNLMFSKLRRRVHHLGAAERLDRLRKLNIDPNLAQSGEIPKDYSVADRIINIRYFIFEARRFDSASCEIPYDIVHTEIIYTNDSKQMQLREKNSALLKNHGDDYLEKMNRLINHLRFARVEPMMHGEFEYPINRFSGNEKDYERSMKDQTPQLVPKFEFPTHHFLKKFYGISPKNLVYHIRECEWRFNHRFDDIYTKLVESLIAEPLPKY